MTADDRPQAAVCLLPSAFLQFIVPNSQFFPTEAQCLI